MTPAAAPNDATAMVVGTDQEIAYDVIDGMAVVEGDIIVGTHAEVQRNGIEAAAVTASTCLPGYQCGTINADIRRQWPNGVVPYTLSPGTSSGARAAIDRAIAEWESKTAIDFVPRTNQRDYVEFRGTGPGNTCSSMLGRTGGRQLINYAGTGQGCLVHEIGHAVGLSHEQNRNDRDNYINIDFTNLSQTGASQFRKATFSTDVGVYDFGSVMHYGPYSFALDRSRPVITPKDPSIPLSAIGGRDVLTESDAQAVAFVYGSNNPQPPPPPPPEPVTTTTSTTAPTTTTTTTTPPTTAAPTTAVPRTTSTTTTTVAPPAPPPPEPQPPTPKPEPPAPQPPAPQPPTPQPPPPAPPTPTPPAPTADVKPTVSFLTHTDGGTMARSLRYGGLQVGAYDANIGTNDGDGIRYVVVVLSDAETGRYLGARREFRSTYDFGVRLTPGRTYTFTAYARANRSAGGGYSVTSITVTAE